LRHGALEFAHDVIEGFDLPEPVVEIGARPAEGQESLADVRPFLAGKHVVGLDIQPGLRVDVAGDVHALPFADESIGTILSFETLEHVFDPLRAVADMHRVLKPGGLLAISSVMFFPIHAHPWDFWRFTPEAFELLLRPFESRVVLAHGWELLPEGVYGVGIKAPGADLGPHRLPRIQALASGWASGLPVDFGPIRMTTRQLWRHTLRASAASFRRRIGAGPGAGRGGH
jgi:SAM-dependent methyltransferase